jgi:phage terminase small subunit
MSIDYSKWTKEQLQAKMTPKQRIFCHEYIIDWNGARSAKEAGYSEKSSRQTANELLTKPYIQSYISLIQKDLEKEAGVSRLKVLKKLDKIAFAKLTDEKDTIKALEVINKMLGYNEPEKQEVTQELTLKDKLKDVKKINFCESNDDEIESNDN